MGNRSVLVQTRNRGEGSKLDAMFVLETADTTKYVDKSAVADHQGGRIIKNDH